MAQIINKSFIINLLLLLPNKIVKRKKCFFTSIVSLKSILVTPHISATSRYLENYKVIDVYSHTGCQILKNWIFSTAAFWKTHPEKYDPVDFTMNS